MRIFRFMSWKEFRAMDAGVHLVHKQRSFKAYTESEGFCFLATDEICKKFNLKNTDSSSHYAYHFLKGIATMDVCVEFEVDITMLKRSMACYAKPYGDYDDCIDIPEYSIMEYDRDMFKPMRYALVSNYNAYDCKIIGKLIPDGSMDWYPYN